MTKRLWIALVVVTVITTASLATLDSVSACGGFFCTNTPVDQNAERIIFTQNKDGTVSAYIQIQYTGAAKDFSWILPLPHPIGPEDIEVPEDAMAAFAELEAATDPVFIPPPMPACATNRLRAMPLAAMADSADVQTFASGEVGPYGFDVIGSEDPDALVNWLRDHNYQVTEEMEPLIDVYVQEGFVFLAMRLLPDERAQDVQPVKLTYPSARPMIPLRLTAVAANRDMAVMVWIYADRQAVPVNYAEMTIDDRELRFTVFGGSNYRQIMGDRADEYGGQAFITEYAAPARELAVSHPLLKDLRRHYAYVTRLNTVISPEEMTVDPVFDYDPQRKDVSNIHDLSDLKGVYDCEGQPSLFKRLFGGDSDPTSGDENSPKDVDPPGNEGIVATPMPAPEMAGNGEIEAAPKTGPDKAANEQTWPVVALAGTVGGLVVVLLAGLVLAGVWLGRRSTPSGRPGAP